MEQPHVIDPNARLHEEWWQGYLETLSPEDRAAEIAGRGCLWRIIAPKLAEACKREEQLPDR